MPDSVKQPPDFQDATIIPFPARFRDAGQRAVKHAADARLQAALGGLQAALDDQARAVAEWRFAMAELGIGVAALRHSVCMYERDLHQLDSRLDGLRTTSRTLLATAEPGLAHAP